MRWPRVTAAVAAAVTLPMVAPQCKAAPQPAPVPVHKPASPHPWGNGGIRVHSGGRVYWFGRWPPVGEHWIPRGFTRKGVPVWERL